MIKDVYIYIYYNGSLDSISANAMEFHEKPVTSGPWGGEIVHLRRPRNLEGCWALSCDEFCGV